MAHDTLRGWKEISQYLGTSESTAKRWEASRRLPVRRIPGNQRDCVIAHRAELDSWQRQPTESAQPDTVRMPGEPAPPTPDIKARASGSNRGVVLGLALATAAVLGVAGWGFSALLLTRSRPPIPARPVAATQSHRAPSVEAKLSAAVRAGDDTDRPAPRGAAMAAPRVVGPSAGYILAPQRTRDVQPAYPAMAQSAHVQGDVAIEAIVAPDGKVQKTKIIRSIPLLDQAALDAVRQWEFVPTLVNGVPVEVVLTVTVRFTLAPGVTRAASPRTGQSAPGA
jgi:TonB family protein